MVQERCLGHFSLNGLRMTYSITLLLVYSETQFLIGDGLMVCPSLIATQVDEFEAYFPAGRWYDYKAGTLIAGDNNQGSTVMIQSNLNDSSPVYLRGGKIAFAEFSSVSNISRTDDLLNRFTVTAGLAKNSDGEYIANGNVMGSQSVSDQDLVDSCILTSCIIAVEVTGDNSQLQISFDSPTGATISIDAIKVLGLDLTGTGLQLDGSASNLAVTMEINGEVEDSYFPVVGEDGTLELTDVLIEVKGQTTISFSFTNSQ